MLSTILMIVLFFVIYCALSVLYTVIKSAAQHPRVTITIDYTAKNRNLTDPLDV